MDISNLQMMKVYIKILIHLYPPYLNKLIQNKKKMKIKQKNWIQFIIVYMMKFIKIIHIIKFIVIKINKEIEVTNLRILK